MIDDLEVVKAPSGRGHGPRWRAACGAGSLGLPAALVVVGQLRERCGFAAGTAPGSQRTSTLLVAARVGVARSSSGAMP